MSRTYIPAPLRQLVRERANYDCEYCLIGEEDTLLRHQVDHIIAEQHGGQTIAENLALACIHCNRLKGPNIASLDPDTRDLTALFNPRTQDWSTHFSVEESNILPLTIEARATVFLLDLNAPLRLEVRENLRGLGCWPR